MISQGWLVVEKQKKLSLFLSLADFRSLLSLPLFLIFFLFSPLSLSLRHSHFHFSAGAACAG